MTIILGMVFILIVISEVPPMIKQGLYKDAVVFLIILALGAVYSIGQIYNWSLPNPTKTMEYFAAPYYENLGSD